MTDLENILPLWRELEAAGADYVLATIVAVEGSSYRKPGARMLLAQDGRRAGTVSGGCLEAEVARRAWWLTADGPVVERYSTLEDDGDLPYGSGCGGVVFILLERRTTAAILITALEAAFDAREPLGVATVLEGPRAGQRIFVHSPRSASADLSADGEAVDSPLQDLAGLAGLAFDRREAIDATVELEGIPTRIWVDYRAARPGLWIFGAGDDAKPVVHLARQLGWFIAVADGRSHLATRNRFPEADEVRVLKASDLEGASGLWSQLRSTDAAVLMTHSFEQDSRILAALLGDRRELPLAYIGVLGPQRRTREALAETLRLLHLPASADRIEQWLDQVHAPMGIDLGAETPATIALSILAEIQQTLSAATALPLREVRAVPAPVSR